MSDSSLTSFDWRLLELLQVNGRMTISELANQLGRSRSNISEHLLKLQDTGILSAISTQIDEEKLGFGISAFVRLQATSAKHREIIEAITKVPEVAECHVLTGAELLIIRVVAINISHLRELVDGFTQFGATQTDIVFSTVKQQLTINQTLRKTLNPKTKQK